MYKILLLMLTLAAAPVAFAQNAYGFNFSFNHLALSVKNPDRSASFYSEKLQLTEIANRTKMEGIQWFALSDGGELHLISTLKDPVVINKAVHLALTTTGFHCFIKLLDDQKLFYSDGNGALQKIVLRTDGIKQVFFQDPDGYWFEVNSITV